MDGGARELGHRALRVSAPGAPANRIGYTAFSLPQLKILQEVITLSVFVPFSVDYMHESVRLDYLWAALCIMGAVFFIFRTPSGV